MVDSAEVSKDAMRMRIKRSAMSAARHDAMDPMHKKSVAQAKRCARGAFTGDETLISRVCHSKKEYAALNSKMRAERRKKEQMQRRAQVRKRSV